MIHDFCELMEGIVAAAQVALMARRFLRTRTGKAAL